MFSISVAPLPGCRSAGPEPPSPEAIADAFVEAYFVHADQRAARRYAAFTAAAMLDRELREVESVRDREHTPQTAGLAVEAQRGVRSSRGQRIRFDYALRYPTAAGRAAKHADIELDRVDGQWRVVRVGVGEPSPRPDSAVHP